MDRILFFLCDGGVVQTDNSRDGGSFALAGAIPAGADVKIVICMDVVAFSYYVGAWIADSDNIYAFDACEIGFGPLFH